MRKIADAKTLFLDRDGVINTRKIGGYIQSVEEFEFIDGVLEAFGIFARLFDTIVVVTNQQGIGKSLMSEKDFENISLYMKNEIVRSGGRLDQVFHCPALAKQEPFDRKPSVGMGLKARKQFPQIRFKDSIMVGDSLSDLIFGKRLGMHTVHISNSNTTARQHSKRTDFRFDNLLEFAKFIEHEKNNKSN